MDLQTRARAVSALKQTRRAGGSDWHFPMVFVIGKHIFFTYMAAYRMQRWIEKYDGKELPIEKVVNTFTDHIAHNENQHGELMPGEVFPSREYARLINA